MRRRIGAHPEIARRADESRAEMMHPDAVHEHARGQRIVTRHDGLRELQPPAGIGRERRALLARDHFKKLALHVGAGRAGVAANEHTRRTGLGAVEHRHRARRCAGMKAIHGSDVAPEALDLVLHFVHEQEVVHELARVKRRVGCETKLPNGLGIGVDQRGRKRGPILTLLHHRRRVGQRDEQIPITFHAPEQIPVELRDRGKVGEFRALKHRGDQRVELVGAVVRGEALRQFACLRRKIIRRQLRKLRPRREQRMPVRRPVREIGFPAAMNGVVQLPPAHELIELRVVRDGLRLMDGHQVGRDVRAQTFQHGQFVRAVKFLGDVLPSCDLGEVVGVFRIEGLRREERRVRRLGRAFEDAVERVVVLRRNRIVFVVVAARASRGQAHQTATHHVDTVVDHVIVIAEEAPADGEKTHRRERTIVIRVHAQLIRRELLDDELVERQILVEGAHHPVAKGVGERIARFLVAADVAFGVRVARHVEPVAAPAFAVVWRGE